MSCGLSKLNLAGLRSLELLDARYNDLGAVPDSIKDCQSLKNSKSV